MAFEGGLVGVVWEWERFGWWLAEGRGGWLNNLEKLGYRAKMGTQIIFSWVCQSLLSSLQIHLTIKS